MGRGALRHGNSRENGKPKYHPQCNHYKFTEVCLNQHWLMLDGKVCQSDCSRKRRSTECNEIRIETENGDLSYWQCQTKNQNANKADQHSLGLFIHYYPFSLVQLIVLTNPDVCDVICDDQS